MPVVRTSGWPLKTAAQELAAAMREARETAIAKGRPAHLFYELGGRYRLDLPETVWKAASRAAAACQLPLLTAVPPCIFALQALIAAVMFASTDQQGRRLYVIVTPVTEGCVLTACPRLNVAGAEIKKNMSKWSNARRRCYFLQRVITEIIVILR